MLYEKFTHIIYIPQRKNLFRTNQSRHAVT